MGIVVGTAGHIDHGKTSLVKALTGTDTDRLPDEKRRGITIDLGFAEMSAGGGRISIVDVPGHERFVRNMLAGASGIDAVLLVVAADDGVMPQTREHFEICRMLGISRGVIAITKTGLCDRETIDLARADVEEMGAGTFLESAPIFEVDSLSRAGIDDLAEYLAAMVAEESGREHFCARFPIDRAFTVKGFGTVVTGTLAAGRISVGDELELFPSRRRVRVRGIQTHHKQVENAGGRTRLALNIAGVELSDVSRGMLLAEPGVLRPTQAIDVKVEMLSSAKSLRDRQRVRFHTGTAETFARVSAFAGEIAAGKTGMIQLRLESPLPLIAGERVIIRSYSPLGTIGGGVIIDPFAKRHSAASRSVAIELLEKLEGALGDEKEMAALIIEASRGAGVTREDITATTGLGRAAVSAVSDSLASDGRIASCGNTLIAAAELNAVKNAVVSAVEAFQAADRLARGMPLDILRRKLRGRTSASVLDHILSVLAEENILSVKGELVSKAGSEVEVTAAEKQFIDLLASGLADARFEVPKAAILVAETAAAAGIDGATADRLVRAMIADKRIVRVSEDLYFSSAAIDEMISMLRTGEANEIDVAAFKTLTGLSRKYAIPLLEYFDREKVTARVGEKRVIFK